MKKYLYSILSLAVGLFSSCSSTDNSELTDNHTTLTLSVEGAMSTRSADGVTYYVEAYTNDTYSEPANIFDDNANKVSNTTGSISMILDRSEKYYFLFFATKDASCYNATDLKAIALQSGKNPSEAWFGITKIDGKTESVKVELKRCVAKLSLIETGVIPANSTLTLTFNQPTKFDVSTGNTSTEASRTETISLTAGFTSSEDNNIINSDDIFVLASSGETGDLSTLTFQMSNSSVTPSTEDAIKVSNVPFQANHNTNIKGHYTSLSAQTFTVTADDAWGKPDNNVAIGGSSVVPNFKSEYTIADYYQWDAWSHFGKGNNLQNNNNWVSGNEQYHWGNDVTASQSCKDCVTFNQLKMYFGAGVYWDEGSKGANQQTYKLPDGNQRNAGLWMKKKQYITGFDDNSATQKDSPDVTTGRPAADVIDQYFFLPATGYYYNPHGFTTTDGSNTTTGGCYWLSTTYTGNASTAYGFRFSSNSVRVDSYLNRACGYIPLSVE